MKALMRRIERFCYKHPRFGIPGLIRFIVIGTGLVFLFGLMDTTNTLHDLLRFSPEAILRGQVWRLISFVFVPIQMHPIWMLLMLYLSFMLGTALESAWGTAKFTIFYLLNVLLLAVGGMLLYLLPIPASMFAGGFVQGYSIHIFLLIAFATLYPDTPFRIFFLIPIRAKWIGLASAGFLVYQMIIGWRLFPINLLPLVLFFVYFLFTWDTWSRFLGLRSRQYSGRVVNFKRAARQVEKQRQARPYSRKCAVCGKTDTDHPEMEFRYCSRCEGYHCFCMEHINDHVHFT